MAYNRVGKFPLLFFLNFWFCPSHSFKTAVLGIDGAELQCDLRIYGLATRLIAL